MRPPSAALGLSYPHNDRGLIPNRWFQPKHSAAKDFAEPIGLGDWSVAMPSFGIGCKPAPPIEMEWHMKRLCHRCGVSPSLLSPKASLTLQPEPDFKWVLLWRDNQRHRPQ